MTLEGGGGGGGGGGGECIGTACEMARITSDFHSAPLNRANGPNHLAGGGNRLSPRLEAAADGVVRYTPPAAAAAATHL